MIDIILICYKFCVSGETEAAPQGCDRQGIAGLDCDGKSLWGGINLPSFTIEMTFQSCSIMPLNPGVWGRAPILGRTNSSGQVSKRGRDQIINERNGIKILVSKPFDPRKANK